MASFPAAVKSFTTKNAGDVIQAAHINDLQDEVNAIEAGYVNGTALVNSSRATHTSLQVSGASTLASLNVSGGSTLGAVQGAASTFTSLSVSGGSTLGTISGGDSTFSGLSAGGSTLGTLNVNSGSQFFADHFGFGKTYLRGGTYLGVTTVNLSSGDNHNVVIGSTTSLLILTGHVNGSSVTGFSSTDANRMVKVLISGFPVVFKHATGSSADIQFNLSTTTGSTRATQDVLTALYVGGAWRLSY